MVASLVFRVSLLHTSESNPLQCHDRPSDTQNTSIRAAYWQREFECHPDRYRNAPPAKQLQMAEKLAKAQEAVDRLRGFTGLSWGLWADFEEFRRP